MNDIQTPASFTLIEKFDNQLLDILTAEIRAAKFSKHHIMDQFSFTKTDDSLKFAS
ncbi:MAG: hypothetical protein JWN56_174 [Sphingobacteriales bacterium]|nr:hypothetical protein [Sphingobacteriales bacterium]